MFEGWPFECMMPIIQLTKCFEQCFFFQIPQVDELARILNNN